MQKIKAVFSDGGNIVFHNLKGWSYDVIHRHLPDLSYEQWRAGFLPYKIKVQTLPNYSKNEAVSDYLTSIGQPELIEAVKAELPDEDSGIELIPNVKTTLKKLYLAKTPFIILTDAGKRSIELMPGLVTCGIDKYVTDVISSKDLGIRKPHPDFFNYALAKHNLKKEDVIFVAHDDDELEGAHKLGFQTYALNFSPTQNLSYLPKGHLLKDFSEIEKIVAESQKTR